LRIEGKNYKSIVFTVLKEKLLNRTKNQTIRTNYIPRNKIGEKTAIAWKNKQKEKEFLYFVKITEIFPIQIKDITLEIAQRDGFDNINICKAVLMDLNNCGLNQWAFVIRWKEMNDVS
jgi:hypothetical protein